MISALLCWPIWPISIRVFPASVSVIRDCGNIVGGKEAKAHSRPYMVLIQGRFLCGGTLINETWVLTAAHCHINSEAKIILGAHSMSGEEKEKQNVKIHRVITHEKFKNGSFDFDVALLQLSEKARPTDAVDILQLPKIYDEPVNGTVCEVAGWGATDSNGDKISDKLMEANVTIMDRSACSEYWRITENMICSSEKKDTGTCVGDSGGPLICDGVLRGIISFGMKKCGVSGSAAVYTYLNSNILRWIDDQLNGLP